MNLSSVLEFSAHEYPDKTAIIFEDKKLAFGPLNAMANRVANALMAAGIGKGDKVALSCPNLPYFPMMYYGILKTGAVVVPLNILLKAREIAYYLKDSNARVYFCFQGTPALPMAHEGYQGFQEAGTCEQFYIITADPQAPSLIEGVNTLGGILAGQPAAFDTVQCSPVDTAIILYTSGTTGFPKGAELTHSNVIMNLKICSEMFQLSPDDIQTLPLPLFHSFGQILMNSGFSKGNTFVFLPRFTPEAVLSAMQSENVTIFAGVPTMYWQILNYADKDGQFDMKKISGTLRLGVSGGSALPGEIKRGFEDKFNISILEGYGLSETSPIATFNQLHKKRKTGSVGTPVWGVEVKVVNDKSEEVPAGDVGEIVIRGHNVMKGYYNRPEATAEAMRGTSWFHTGDLGKMDEEGYFYIVDRAKDMIIRGGFNIYPREIEEVLITHPAVSLSAVIGVPDAKLGEEVKAYIVLKEGSHVTEKELMEWSKEQMAAYKYPRSVEIRQSLPMTATGKILKKELKAENSAKMIGN